MSLKLKSPPQFNLPPLPPTYSSTNTHRSEIPSSHPDPRAYYLLHPSLVPPPLISCSPFLPRSLIEHLMLSKKPSALAVKFSAHSGTDRITNMEGAFHTFITPIIPRCEMVGDYVYRLGKGHGITVFGTREGRRLTRSVVLSASIQMDFENDEVMMHVSRLGSFAIQGRELEYGWKVARSQDKQDPVFRRDYDASLRAHMIYHLIRSHILPSISSIPTTSVLSVGGTQALLEELIKNSTHPAHHLENRFLNINTSSAKDSSTKVSFVALELLYNAAVQLLRNELSGLEALCPQGYVYTYDPASIFATTLPAFILNRLMLCALKTLSLNNTFTHLRIFAFNDYAEDKNFMSLVRDALRNQEKGVWVTRKVELFMGEEGTYDLSRLMGIRDIEKAMLVIHNNSDAFGQNIETEGVGGSMDGAMGASSSAAASLMRGREDLLKFLC